MQFNCRNRQRGRDRRRVCNRNKWSVANSSLNYEFICIRDIYKGRKEGFMEGNQRQLLLQVDVVVNNCGPRTSHLLVMNSENNSHHNNRKIETQEIEEEEENKRWLFNNNYCQFYCLSAIKLNTLKRNIFSASTFYNSHTFYHPSPSFTSSPSSSSSSSKSPTRGNSLKSPTAAP